MSFLYFSSFIFKENHNCNEEDSPSQNVVLTEEELDDIDIDEIRNLEGRFKFINEGCGNLKVVD